MQAQGTSGGILYVWENCFMRQVDIIKGDRWICIKGFIDELKMMGAIVVVYGYHDAELKRQYGKKF